jgi:hypothetical protein
MSVREWLAQLDPVLTAAGTFLTAATGFGAWVIRARSQERARREKNNVGRFDDAAGANARLFETLDEIRRESALNYRALQQRCDDCEKREAILRGRVLRCEVYSEKLADALRSHGLTPPPMPLLVADEDEVPTR